jgi:hypothetical protein
MSSFGFPTRPSLYSRTLRECRQLYLTSGELVAQKHAELLDRSGNEYVQLMDDLHRALVLKVYLTVCEADKVWSQQERLLAEVLCHHLWGQWLEGEQLRDTIKQSSAVSGELDWNSLVRPFSKLEPLRERVGELATLVTRLGNLVARCDGNLNEQEKAALRTIDEAILGRLPEGQVESPEQAPHEAAEVAGKQAIKKAQSEVDDIYRAAEDPAPRTTWAPPTNKPLSSQQKPPTPPTPQASLEDALAELEKLIGLGSIKQEVRSLTNFIRLQQRREEAGLPETEISLHMVFTGNPGTGKTTVARVIGNIYGALGVLAKGQLIETDRSGLVAEYAGQTGPKTNAKIDEALDGMLFIDEAYSLVAAESEDPYGREAIQTLLKRAEDDRDRLVVTLAGYPDEMLDLLRSNPGLSSRFSRQLEFEDYLPLELSQIFGLMCKKSHYELTPAARLKVMVGLRWLFDRRDRHFGNGRTSRNLFENAVRRMANRLADETAISPEQLVTLEVGDIEFPTIPAVAFEELDESLLKLHLICPDCLHTKDVPMEFLGKRVKCPKCQAGFEADWGELVSG